MRHKPIGKFLYAKVAIVYNPSTLFLFSLGESLFMISNSTLPDKPSRNFSYVDPVQFNYVNNAPFPHAIIKNAWNLEILEQCKREIAEFDHWDGEKDFFGSKKKRYCGDVEALPLSVGSVIKEASSPAFLRWLEELTGEKALIPDPYLEGGGIHSIKAGGFLKIHADFNWNERLKLYRRVNVLIYLNSDWQPEWGGALELWTTDMTTCVQNVLPHINTMAIFTTDDKSFHGHPHPLTTPDGVTRDSIALYYYSPIHPAVNFKEARINTDYQPIPGDDFEIFPTTLTGRVKRKLKQFMSR
jgi:hypothetical protein